MEDKIMSIKRLRNKSLRLTFLLFIFALAFGSIIFAGPSRLSQAIALASTHQPEKFTELYFIDQLHLPILVKPKVENNFSFRIINHEGTTTDYSYIVYQQTQQGEIVMSHGEVSLQAEKSAQIKSGFKIDNSNTRADIVVSINNGTQKIYFRTQS